MKNLTRFGKVNLGISIILFVGGTFLLIKELREDSFSFFPSTALVFIFIGIGLFFASFQFTKEKKGE